MVEMFSSMKWLNLRLLVALLQAKRLFLALLEFCMPTPFQASLLIRSAFVTALQPLNLIAAHCLKQLFLLGLVSHKNRFPEALPTLVWTRVENCCVA